jgi:type IV pilus assembly protein PilA
MHCGEEMASPVSAPAPACRGLTGYANNQPVFSGTPETSGKAIGSLVCGIFFFVLPSAIAAVLLGHSSHTDIRNSGGGLRGSRMATAGLILGYLGIAIIPVMIIAAIAIPNLLRARCAANEASAVVSLRQINQAAQLYNDKFGHFPATLANLGPGAHGGPATEESAGLLDPLLAHGQKSGYIFTFTAESTLGGRSLDAYEVGADPITTGTTGFRHFFTDQTGLIRVEQNRLATRRSQPIQ